MPRVSGPFLPFRSVATRQCPSHEALLHGRSGSEPGHQVSAVHGGPERMLFEGELGKVPTLLQSL